MEDQTLSGGTMVNPSASHTGMLQCMVGAVTVDAVDPKRGNYPTGPCYVYQLYRDGSTFLSLSRSRGLQISLHYKEMPVDSHVYSLLNMKTNSTMSAQMLEGQMAGSDVQQLQTLTLTNCNTGRFWTEDVSTAIHYQINSESALTWHQARKSYQQQNAELLSITEIHEQEYMGEELRPIKRTNGWCTYAGHCYSIQREPKLQKGALTSRKKQDGDLASVHNIAEYSFLESQLSHRKEQGCVAMGTGIAARLWDVVSCEKTANYLCEERAEGVAPPAHPVQVPAATCAEGWDGVSWTDSCFKVSLCLLQNTTNEMLKKLMFRFIAMTAKKTNPITERGMFTEGVDRTAFFIFHLKDVINETWIGLNYINSKDPELFHPTTPPVSDFIHYGNSSYSIIRSKRNREEARKACK
uniref:Macrophage mannose receptor 1-like protein 1 n=1 Tax=Columba livia TaxID=8932 RepID=R7VWR7_COLLI